MALTVALIWACIWVPDYLDPKSRRRRQRTKAVEQTANPRLIKQLERECEIRDEAGELVQKPFQAGLLANGEAVITRTRNEHNAQEYARRVAEHRAVLEAQGRPYEVIETMQDGPVRVIPRDGLPIFDRYARGGYMGPPKKYQWSPLPDWSPR